MTLEFKAIQPIEYYRKFFEQKVRPDGRSLLKVRPTSINIGSLSNADGSALIRLGNTSVICGIKAELALPKPDEANKGYLANFRPGPPSEQAQVSSQLVLKILNSSKCVNLEELCIQEGKLPEVIVEADTGQPKVDLNKTHPLNICSFPIATTFAVFDDNIILIDPTSEEECLANGVLTVASLENDELCGMYKPGGLGLDDVCIQECITHVLNRGKQVRQLIEEAISALSES